MATEYQKRVANKVIENATLDKPLNGGEILESIGYSQAIVKNPQMVLESKGVKEELAIRGFTEENAKTVVGQILLNKKVKPDTRINAAKEIFKVQGSYAPEKHIGLEVKMEGLKLNPKAMKLKEEYEKKLLEAIQE